MGSNKYSIYKLVMFPEKLAALAEGRVTAPIYVRIKPTNRCNQGCKFCTYGHGGYEGRMHDDVDLRDVMPTDKALEIINDLADIGTRAVTFSGGGEPTIHPGICDMLRLCRERGLAYSIITNGQNLEGRVADELAHAAWVRVSIDYWSGQSLQEARGVKLKFYDQIDSNLRRFNTIRKGDFESNIIITQSNYLHIFEMALWLKGVGMDNVRFSPVWYDNFVEYHQPIMETVVNHIADAKRTLEDDRFKVLSSYRVSADVGVRGYHKCCFQQIVPAIGADQRVFVCQNQSYTDTGTIGSLRGRKFSDLWFSPETKKFFDGFDADVRCNGVQCAADAKNRLYLEILNTSPDAFV